MIIVAIFIFLRIIAFILGLGIVAGTFTSALRTFVLPRGAPDVINRTVFIGVRWLFALRAKRSLSFLALDRIMELYAPTTLILLRQSRLVLRGPNLMRLWRDLLLMMFPLRRIANRPGVILSVGVSIMTLFC